MSLQNLFAQVPVLTHDEVVAHLNAEQSGNERTRESLLAYYVKTGRLVRVRKGLYAVVPLGAKPETHPVDPFLLAAKMTDDAILAYHTALEFFGKAHSVFEEFRFLTGRPFHPAAFRSYRFRGSLFPKALRRKGKEHFGVKTVDRSGVDVRVTSLERTLVDVLDRPDLGGGWEEIWLSLELVEFFDLDTVVKYVLMLDNATTTAKVGYFLDQHREQLMVEDAHLKPLKKRRPKQPHYMERNGRGEGHLVSEWNLVVPAYVAERGWEEAR